MKMDSSWGLQKPISQMTERELRAYIVENSSCEVSVSGLELTRPAVVQIDFYGPAALIPSLKNSRITGKTGRSFPNKKVIAAVRAMDILFAAACEHPIYYGEIDVFCLLILGNRPATFDADNALTTVKDWLEPRKMKGGRTIRDWGIGLVEDDRYVSGMALHSRKFEPQAHTTIIIHPYCFVEKEINRFINSIII